ncbi:MULTISPECIES: hypothetical protein [unclassified Iodidimonas]|jgi:iron complex outermembrane receptor protein|uniref:hypothetical protein n=1 Tax=unclassified Iodidimonas TaxID=2626145 RepID=UPI00248262D2|nr:MULTISPECIES: hypothetical protein [unclassified Iodidimonas]
MPHIHSSARLRKHLLSGLAPLAFVLAAPSFAQTESAGLETTDLQQNAERNRVEEIVVTGARRRDENVQTVPIPITVFSGEFIDKTGTWNVARLTELQPTLQFFSSNPRNSALNIRGIGAPSG